MFSASFFDALRQGHDPACQLPSPGQHCHKIHVVLPLPDKCLHGDPQARRQLLRRLSGTALAAPSGGDSHPGHAGQLHQLITIDVPLSHPRYEGYSVDKD